MCESCGKVKCCCKEVISKQGLRGKQGVKGPTGLTGPAYAYLTASITPFAYTAGELEIFAADFVCSKAGYFSIWYEATFYPLAASNDTITVKVTKNGVLIPLAGDEVKYLTGTPNQSYKSAINTGVLLALNDRVNVTVSSGKDFNIGHRSLMLIPVTILTTF